MITIKEPIWNGGNRAIGVSEAKIHEGINEIEISYKSKRTGDRLYPYTFGVLGKEFTKYPRDRKNPHLRVIPIRDLMRRE